jgi:SNF2 family DNA or RNA helicase
MILADEMGLGKTVQTIAFIACLRCGFPVFLLSSKCGRDTSSGNISTVLLVHNLNSLNLLFKY